MGGRALDGIAPWQVDVREGPVMFPAELALDGALLRSINVAHAEAGLAAARTFYSHGALDAGGVGGIHLDLHMCSRVLTTIARRRHSRPSRDRR